jgi:hypothetical protein
MKLWAEEVQVWETAFQAQIAALSDDLAAKRLQQRYDFHFYYLWLPEPSPVSTPSMQPM